MHRRAFKSQSCHTADKPGRLIHSNVGLYEEVSREGYKYYVNFVNDHSKFVSVFPMKSKSPVFNCFKLFGASFEKDKCFGIMSLRSDNGGEYTSNEFTKCILSEEGIAHEPGPPHSPELNGVAKQMNRTISNLVRCSLLTAKLPKNFWADALRHLMFTLNSIPCHTPAGFLSPNSILGLPAVDLTYLHSFGCLAWHKVPEANRRKLDVKGHSGILLSYIQDGNGYQVWDLQRRAVIKSWDVLFEDTQFPYVPSSPPQSDGQSDCRDPSPTLPATNDVNTPSNSGPAQLPPVELSDPIAPAPSSTLPALTGRTRLLEQPCSTGGRTDTVRPKREPTGRTDLSDRSRLVLCNRSQELIGQACPTRRQMLRSDSACPTTGRTRLFEHRSNCRVRPVNAGSATHSAPLAPTRVSTRTKKKPDCYGSWAKGAAVKPDIDTPKTWCQLLKSPTKQKWLKAADEEFSLLLGMGTWCLVPRPAKRKIIKSNWVFKVKRRADNSIQKLKARLVAMGFTQAHGIDYDKVFAPTLHQETFCLVCSILANKKWKARQVNFKTAFLNSRLAKPVYMEQPQGFKDSAHSNYVCEVH
ncbi:hypothetical protein PCANC_01882 [Puccinia coronata f. sp. avenae]|uniref:Integrase catalytic domain-containing protein n=1 Tax=Puccinia coronata f. sp. avenae TaxID=200324 RepID=A0A2N5W4H2_9BASI|nr:hypothetical protein PCANC_01882 [Puccinia coronata f. sp. avenae]